MTAPMMTTNCPTDPELLAAFVDGRLNHKERGTVIEHMATCAECRDVVMTASEMAEMSGVGQVVTPKRGWVVPAITLAAAAAIGAVVFLGPVGDQIMRPRRIAALSKATAELEERPTATRPSIAIAYKYKSTFRGREANAEYALYAPAFKLVDAAKKRPTVENLHAAGVALLLLPDPQFRDQAVTRLEQALTKQTGVTDVAQAIAASSDADLLNDLAAAYYESGKQNEAESAIARAWQLKRSPPIAWTRATILQNAQAWKDYLAIDDTSEWAKEARGKLDLYTGN